MLQWRRMVLIVMGKRRMLRGRLLKLDLLLLLDQHLFTRLMMKQIVDESCSIVMVIIVLGDV